jgi:hypothetical protein
MSVNNKHIATFLLGAAAAVAAMKYMNMSQEEKDKLAGDLKDKANKIKTEAEGAFEKAKEYFEELKTKGTESFKEHFGDAEKMMGDLFNKKEEPKTT